MKEPGTLPAPSADEQKAIRKARENKSKRRPAVKLALKQKSESEVTTESLHSDQQGWQDRLSSAFGTRSTDFVDAELQRVLTMFRGKDGKIDIPAVEAVLAVLDGSEPANEVEAMLLIQMATTHALAMRIARRLSTVDTIQQNDSASVTLARLHRAFTMQVETLAAMRRGGKQKVIVEHVHVYPGGQAIVGNVTTGGTGAGIGKGQQPQAIEQFTRGGELWSENQERDALPITAGTGQAPLPNARRGTGHRGATGRAKRKLSSRAANNRGHSRAARANGIPT